MQPNETKDLFAALAKAQSEIEGAAKANENPHFRSKYADLASVWAACRAPLCKNGLSIWQHTVHGEDGKAYLRTTIGHTSGQSLSDDGIPLLLSKQDMQGLGSALTYARRYGLMAAVGIAPEDDDGNAASQANGNDARAVTVQTGVAKAKAKAAPKVEVTAPEKPGPILVPASEDMGTVWVEWCKCMQAKLATPEASEWVRANEATLKNLRIFNAAWHQKLMTGAPTEKAA